jgi:hypothetical protein
VDELVTFTASASAGAGEITLLEWDLDDDGLFDDASGASVTWSFPESGIHPILLRATQTDGKRTVAFSDVQVAPRPVPQAEPQQAEPQPPSAGGGVADSPGVRLPAARRLVRMRPFPVVRIAGTVLPRGAKLTVLSVRAPRGAVVTVRCRGRGCPVRSLIRPVTSRLLRVRRFERRLPAGTRLELFVRKGRTVIGKYTRFRILGGEPPARADRCLLPGRARPVRCA